MRSYKMRGGNANTLPQNILRVGGRYSATLHPGECAYGNVVPQSFGMQLRS